MFQKISQFNKLGSRNLFENLKNKITKPFVYFLRIKYKFIPMFPIGSAARRLPSAAASSSAVNAELPPTPLMDKSYCNLPASFLRQRDFELPDAFLTPPHKVVAPTIIRGSPQPPPPVFSSILNHATLNGRGRTLTKRSQLSIDNSQLAKVTARKKVEFLLKKTKIYFLIASIRPKKLGGYLQSRKWCRKNKHPLPPTSLGPFDLHPCACMCVNIVNVTYAHLKIKLIDI
jgi:hypothetical protein